MYLKYVFLILFITATSAHATTSCFDRQSRRLADCLNIHERRYCCCHEETFCCSVGCTLFLEYALTSLCGCSPAWCTALSSGAGGFCCQCVCFLYREHLRDLARQPFEEARWREDEERNARVAAMAPRVVMMDMEHQRPRHETKKGP